MRWLSIPTAIATLVFITPAAHATASIIELMPAYGWPAAQASAVNEAGLVSGMSASPNPFPRPSSNTAVRWDGPDPTPLGSGNGVGINSQGDVLVHWVRKVAGPLISSMGVWSNGTTTRRTPPENGLGVATTRDINDAGVVPVAYNGPGYDDYYPDHAGAWRNGTFAQLPLGDTGSRVVHRLVNNRGTTAGARHTGEESYAFRCSSTRCTRLPGIDEASFYYPMALNESDAVAGHAYVAGKYRAVLWSGDSATALPGEDAQVSDNVHAINRHGDVVGWLNHSGTRKPVLWRDGKAIDLGTSGFGEAIAVNDRGDVVGWDNGNDGFRVFLWRAGTLTTLPQPEGVLVKPAGLSNSGFAIGNSIGLPDPRAFRWTLS
ncbi:hypothetical protein [Actinosynnema sp. NPDC023587]|uniref:hypothetical protein n=1 Tax=Actinosynnema sp. NPDC023587 TaxID=3154695 RepID=UPI0033FC1A4E